MFRNREIKRFVIYIAAVCGIITAVCFFINVSAGIASAAALIAPTTGFYVFTRRRYKEITGLSEKLGKIAAGELSLDVRDNDEGELSILRNEIYKVTSKLTEQAAVLESDKAALANNLSDISHQLKTPLTSLLVMSELLEDKDLPPAKRSEFTSNIKTGLTRMEWLALALLKLAELDAGAAVIKKEIINAEDLAVMAVQSLDVILAAKNQRVVHSGDKNVNIACDMDWTVEALANVIKNASEHSPAGEGIAVSWEETPLAVQITVEDSGGGVDPKDLPHLFKRFYKGAGAAKESAGIGLALSLDIMRRQNGDIGIINKPGKGAAFILKFYK